MLARSFFLALLGVCMAIIQVNAQVTSARMSGIVKNDTSQTFIGAQVRAVHLPSGTVYGAVVGSDNTFTIEGMRVGGPYEVTVGYGNTILQRYDSIMLELGETYQLLIENAGMELGGVSVTAKKDNILNSQRTGATTVITADEIATQPSISRTAFDFTKLTPQSNGTSFEGRDNHYNNVRINGANFNNAFGLSTGFAGGGMPIPLDAVQEIQVAISDFDVKQTEFTGANINLVTRSGDNHLTGSAYIYYRDQSFNGTHVGSSNLPPLTKSVNNIYGVRIGGPIIKNKLFFFASGEYEKNVHPGISPDWIANGPGVTGANISRTTIADLTAVSDYVKNTYGYNTGGYQDFANNFTNTYARFLARMDYNINEKNKLNVSYSYYNATTPSTVNSSSAAGGNLPSSRIGSNSLAFANTDYSTVDKVNSISAELNSTITTEISNQLLVTYTNTHDTRSTPSSMFPFVDIFDGSSNTPANYMSLGYELFSYKNDVKQNSLVLLDNLTIHKGFNNISAGLSYQYLSFANSYLPYGTGYFRYNSVNDFLTNAAPSVFGLTYAYDGQDGYARMKYGLPGIYAQDKINLLHNKLVLTGGIRVDMPLYLNSIPNNQYIDTLNLANPHAAYNNGYGTAYHTTHYNASAWPTEKPVVSPRFGFNWSPLAERTLQVRGGSGIFMGDVPFVWFTNAPANSGTVTNNVQIKNTAVLQSIKFATNPAAVLAELSPSVLATYFPKQSGNAVPGLIAAIDPSFKMPRVWRSDLSADYKLPWLGLVATAELMYTKDIYAVNQFNANLPNPVSDLKDSTDHRPYLPGGRIYPNISGAYILTNTQQGYAYSGTIGLSRTPRNGFYGSLYYTYMNVEEVSSNPGSQASSAWFYLAHIVSPNEMTLAPSAYFTPHRIVASASYRITYLKHLASTLSVYYNGSFGGRFSYTSYNDINGDGNYYDLIYIPKDVNEMKWGNITNLNTGAVLFTGAQQAAAFEKYIEQDKYLSTHRGQYAQRNGAQYPWYNTVNLKFIQDVFTNFGKYNNSLQFSVDIFNLPNLLSKNWGIQKMLTVSGGEIITGSTNSQGITYYKMETVTNSQGQTVLPTSTFTNSVSTSSTWSMQLGLRYNF